MRRLLLSLCLLLLITGFVAGQNDPTPWLPDAETLFAEGVDVLSMELLETTPQSFADNERRVVHIYDEATGEWQEYDYPEASSGNHSLTRRSDDTFLLTSYSPYANWVINPTEGTMTSLELVCGYKTPALPGEGAWHYVAGDEGERAYLCFTETDEHIPLPDEISDLGSEFASEPTFSPDGQWLVAITLESEDIINVEQDYYYYEVYSYEVVSGRLNYLGRIGHNTMASYPPFIMYNWVSDSRGLITYGPPQESSSKSYYSFDTSQPDSLELIAEGWVYDFYDNPPRYEYVSTSGFLSWKTGSYIPPEYGGCFFWRYDANGVQQHELGFDCIGANIFAGSNHLTTLRVDSEPAEFSTLVTYDLTTREFAGIVSGEIEWLLGGSYPYALLLMDDNGQIDLVTFYPMDGLHLDTSEYWWLGNVEGAYIAVLNMSTGEFVYDSSSTHRVSPAKAVFSQWMGDDRFVYSLAWREQTLTLVVLGKDGAHEYTVEGVSQGHNMLRLSPGGYRMVVYMPQEQVIGIADFLSGEVHPLMSSDITTNYHVSFEWIEDNILRVTMSQYHSSGSASVVYTVRIP